MSNKLTAIGISEGYIYKHVSTEVDGNKTTLTVEKGFHEPNIVQMNLDASDNTINIEADNEIALTYNANLGYSGTLEQLRVSEKFQTEILGFYKDEKTGLIVENSNVTTSPFLYEVKFLNDVTERRYYFLNVTTTRPALGAMTKGESVQNQNVTLNFVASPVNNIVKINESDNITSDEAESFKEDMVFNYIENGIEKTFEIKVVDGT